MTLPLNGEVVRFKERRWDSRHPCSHLWKIQFVTSFHMQIASSFMPVTFHAPSAPLWGAHYLDRLQLFDCKQQKPILHNLSCREFTGTKWGILKGWHKKGTTWCQRQKSGAVLSRHRLGDEFQPMFTTQMVGRGDLNDLACAMNLTTCYLLNSEQVL